MRLALIIMIGAILSFSDAVQPSQSPIGITSHKTGTVSATDSKSIYDTPNLRSAANFEIEVADGVYWIPANNLGRTRYSNAQIAAMTNLSPEQKQAAINTLFEAIQLFQISKFKGTYDNIKITENGIDWEHHKPGYDAVRTNEGCCASDSSWLNYILKNDYDGIGTCGFGQHDGNGHIINYIKHNGWYYFVDMMQYRLDSLPSSGIETGHIKDYLKAYDPVAGNIHRSKSIEKYIEYLKGSLKHTPCFFITCNKDYCPPIGLRFADGKTSFIYPKDAGIDIHYQDTPKTRVEIMFLDQPHNLPDWSKLPIFHITPVELAF
jgi:hypothetical protein